MNDDFFEKANLKDVFYKQMAQKDKMNQRLKNPKIDIAKEEPRKPDFEAMSAIQKVNFIKLKKE